MKHEIFLNTRKTYGYWEEQSDCYAETLVILNENKSMLGWASRNSERIEVYVCWFCFFIIIIFAQLFL